MPIFKPASIALLLICLSMPALATTLDEEMAESHKRNLAQQGVDVKSGLSFSDTVSLQLADGLLNEADYEKALSTLKPLLQKYPENISVRLLEARALIDKRELEQARLILESLRKKVDPDKDADLTFRILALHISSYLVSGEAEHADKIFRAADLKPRLLSESVREEYDLLRADLLYSTHKSPQAMEQMLELAKRNPFAAENMYQKGDYVPDKAADVYQEARNAYARKDYEKALSLALVARRLDPFRVEYSRLVTESNHEVERELAYRFKTALPLVKKHIEIMRDALAFGDYHDLYRAYLRFKADEDIAFVMKPVYRNYLPTQMYRMVAEVEEALRNEGFDF